MTEPKERSVTLSWTPGEDHNSPVLGTVYVFFLFMQHMQSIYDTCSFFEILIDFLPFKCQMLYKLMVEQNVILQFGPTKKIWTFLDT